jgi:DNA-binding MarR family transcriptional regulator
MPIVACHVPTIEPAGDCNLSFTSDKWVNLKPLGGNLEVEDFLSMRFANLSALLHRSVTKQYLARHDIGLPEWRVLTMLVRYGSVTTRKLRDASGMDKGQMSRALRELEQRALLERDADATHELRQVLRISDAGTALYNRIMPDARKSQAALLAHLTLGERKALDSALRKLKTVAEAEPAEGRKRPPGKTGSKKK